MSENRKRRKRIFVIILLSVLTVYIALGVMDFCGVFVHADYKGNLTVGERDYTIITLSACGKIINENGVVDDVLTYNTLGTKIIFYQDGKLFATGKLQNGVITASTSILNGDVNQFSFYENGNVRLDENHKMFVDYVRIIVSPISTVLVAITGWIKLGASF